MPDNDRNAANVPKYFLPRCRKAFEGISKRGCIVFLSFGFGNSLPYAPSKRNIQSSTGISALPNFRNKVLATGRNFDTLTP